jgi:hypothetical protein
MMTQPQRCFRHSIGLSFSLPGALNRISRVAADVYFVMKPAGVTKRILSRQTINAVISSLLHRRTKNRVSKNVVPVNVTIAEFSIKPARQKQPKY